MIVWKRFSSHFFFLFFRAHGIQIFNREHVCETLWFRFSLQFAVRCEVLLFIVSTYRNMFYVFGDFQQTKKKKQKQQEEQPNGIIFTFLLYPLSERMYPHGFCYFFLFSFWRWFVGTLQLNIPVCCQFIRNTGREHKYAA